MGNIDLVVDASRRSDFEAATQKLPYQYLVPVCAKKGDPGVTHTIAFKNKKEMLSFVRDNRDIFGFTDIKIITKPTGMRGVTNDMREYYIKKYNLESKLKHDEIYLLTYLTVEYKFSKITNDLIVVYTPIKYTRGLYIVGGLKKQKLETIEKGPGKELKNIDAYGENYKGPYVETLYSAATPLSVNEELEWYTERHGGVLEVVPHKLYIGIYYKSIIRYKIRR